MFCFFFNSSLECLVSVDSNDLKTFYAKYVGFVLWVFVANFPMQSITHAIYAYKLEATVSGRDERVDSLMGKWPAVIECY